METSLIDNNIDEKYIKRFWGKSRVNYENYYAGEFCQEWMGGKRETGDDYGVFRFGKITEYAHRFSWIISFGKIPKGKYVLHSCDNRWCINPKHLFLGTHQDNMDDKKKKGRMGEHVRKLKKQDVLEIRKLWDSGEFFQYEIAEKFSISVVHVFNIIKKKAWGKI